MCGIAGYFNAAPQKELLLSMISQLEHRGPDGFGYYIDNRVGLAHARLSIIDLQNGDQPITNEDKTVWVTFNGEIYNYIELREILVERGHEFKTASDTEVIVHAYEEFGKDCVPMFNGQFAFALWDSEKKIGILARDRVGIQPLFYATGDNNNASDVFFASEVKGLLANPLLRRGLNKRQIANVFTYWSPSHNESVFNGINEVPPGFMLIIEGNDAPQLEKYWDHDYTKRVHGDFDLKYHLQNSIDFRLRADVPVAAYLSGGLDSSVIAYLASERMQDNMSTFSIAFEDAQYDESSFQKEMKNWVGVDHHTFTCNQADIANVFPKVVFHAEKPLFRTAPAPMFLLSKAVKEAGFKVVLTGEGADEVFAGYDIFRESHVRRLMVEGDTDPALINHMLHNLYPWMGSKMLTSSTDYLKVFFGGSKDEGDMFSFSHAPRKVSSSKSHKFFADEEMEPYSVSKYYDWQRFIQSDLDRAQYVEWKTLFNGYLMSSQGDRMLMANGVEGRFPFLDPNVVDYGNSLEDRYKLKVDDRGDMTEKFILKKFARDKRWVPTSIIDRKKQPYMAPDAACFVGDNAPEYAHVLMGPSADYGYFNMKKIGILKKKFELGKAHGFSDNMAFVGALSTQLLHHKMIDNFEPVDIMSPRKINVAVEKL